MLIVELRFLFFQELSLIHSLQIFFIIMRKLWVTFEWALLRCCAFFFDDALMLKLLLYVLNEKVQMWMTLFSCLFCGHIYLCLNFIYILFFLIILSLHAHVFLPIHVYWTSPLAWITPLFYRSSVLIVCVLYLNKREISLIFITDALVFAVLEYCILKFRCSVTINVTSSDAKLLYSESSLGNLVRMLVMISVSVSFIKLFLLAVSPYLMRSGCQIC